MIAKIEPSFSSMSTLERKVDYQLEKISSGVARELYNTTGDSLCSFPEYMYLYSNLNNRVKLPYSEITLNLSPGEKLSDDDWIRLSNDYMREMGYDKCCYSVILNSDKDHSHVHILHSRIDCDGNSILNSFDFNKSEALSRQLEIKYGLNQALGNDKIKVRLSSVSAQRFFFDNALKKAIKNHAVQDRLMDILDSSGIRDMLGSNFLKSKLSNDEWLSILGSHDYEAILSVLKRGGFLKSLYKEALLSKMDMAYMRSKTFQDFRLNLRDEGVYMRLTSKKDKSYYVYGLSDDSFYIKDSSLPMKYRYGNMQFDSYSMSYDEQKHFIYNKLLLALTNSSSFDDYENNLDKSGINIKELVNKGGIYGLSYSIKNIETPFVFKASDISRRFTYKNIQNEFSHGPIPKDDTINRVGELKEHIIRDNDYMSHSPIPYVPDIEITGGKKTREDDYVPSKKRKKLKNNDLSL